MYIIKTNNMLYKTTKFQNNITMYQIQFLSIILKKMFHVNQNISIQLQAKTM